MQHTEVVCPRCGGILELSLDKTHGICPYCNFSYLLNEDELEIVKEAAAKRLVLRRGYIDTVREICGAHKKKGDGYFYVGKSLRRKWAYRKFRKNFKIPKEDDAFFLYDATVLGTRKKGFALCTSGIYYCECEKKELGKFTWEEFKELKIYNARNDAVFLGEIYFETCGVAKETAELLNEIQRRI